MAARANRELLAKALGGAGLVNYPHGVVALELQRPSLGADDRVHRKRSTARRGETRAHRG
jgi:hypothetical protein